MAPTKLRSSDGANLRSFPVGSSPSYVAFDGTNIWVTNYGDNTVVKPRVSDGVSLGVFPTGNSPEGIAFDGNSIWVANVNDNKRDRHSCKRWRKPRDLRHREYSGGCGI